MYNDKGKQLHDCHVHISWCILHADLITKCQFINVDFLTFFQLMNRDLDDKEGMIDVWLLSGFLNQVSLNSSTGQWKVFDLHWWTCIPSIRISWISRGHRMKLILITLHFPYLLMALPTLQPELDLYLFFPKDLLLKLVPLPLVLLPILVEMNWPCSYPDYLFTLSMSVTYTTY